MANNPYVNKVQKADGTVIIDISDSTAVASDVAAGKYFYGANGEKVQGTASGPAYTATITGNTNSKVTYNGVDYRGGSTFEFYEDDIASITVRGTMGCYVYVDGVQVSNGMTPLVYNYTLPGYDVHIDLSHSAYAYVTFNTIAITSDGTYDVEDYIRAEVNVSSGGGLPLISTTSLGTLSTSSTSATNTNKSLSLASSTNWDDYDLLIIDVSVDSPTNGRHTSTVSLILITHQSSYGTPSNYTVAGNKWNSKRSSSGTGSTRQSTSAYGIYANSVSVSSNTMSIPLYYRYNSNSTGTINGSYTARVYGVKLYDLIGG